MDPKLFPPSDKMPDAADGPVVTPLPARDPIVSPFAAVWTPSKPTIDQTRQVAIQTIQQNFQAIDEQLFSAGFVRKSGDTMTGGLALNNTGSSPGFNWLAGGLFRYSWQVGGAETGSDAGSNMVLYSFTDAGALKYTMMSLTRSNGQVAFGAPTTTPNLIGANSTADGNNASTSQIVSKSLGGNNIAMVTWVIAGDQIVAALSASRPGTLILHKNDGSGAFVTGSVFEGAIVKYTPAASASVALAPTSANAFVLNVPVGGCSVTVAGLSEGVVYRLLLRNTQNGTVTLPASFKFPVGSPAIGASPLNRAVVTFWWSADDAAAYCSLAQY